MQRGDSKLGVANEKWRLCEKARLAFFFATPRHFDFLNCESKTSKCILSVSTRCSCHLYKCKKQTNKLGLQDFVALQKKRLQDTFAKKLTLRDAHNRQNSTMRFCETHSF